MHLKLSFWAAISATSVFATSNIELRGMFDASPSSEYALVDRDSGLSKWVKIGDNFEGYQVVGFDKVAGLLTLHSSAEDIRLKLAEASVVNAQALSAQFPKSLADRGITVEDLIIRHSAGVVIYLSPGVQSEPVKRRHVDVRFQTPKGNFEATWDVDDRVPAEILEYVTKTDIEAIDRHIAIVRAKWNPE
jgi:hypothetical protein